MAAVEDHPVDGVEVDYSTEIAQEMSAMGAGEIVGVVVAVVVLLIMLRTAVGAALPVLTAFVGVGFSTMLALSLILLATVLMPAIRRKREEAFQEEG